jgi:hypothetical protein
MQAYVLFYTLHSLLGGLGFPHLGENIAQFFTLPLGPQVSSQLRE